MKNGSVKINDTEMYYVRFGVGEKILTVLPGLSDGLTTVKGKALLLAGPYMKYRKEYTVYMFSRKEDMPEGYSIQDMAADQIRALKLLGIEKTSVLGVSEGGMIAVYMCADAPEMIEKAVLAVTAPAVNPVIEDNIRRWITFTEKGDHKGLMRDTAECMYSGDYLRKNRMALPLISLVGKPETYDRFRINAEAILHCDAENRLSDIRCPVLIIGGKKDRIVGPQASLQMHEMIAGSELYMYETIGHAPNDEDKAFYDRVFSYLNRS